MEEISPWLSLSFILTVPTGFVFFLVGILLFLKPPKSINSWYGYRTPNAMKSQERWDFAQVYAAKLMVIVGFLLVILGYGIQYLPVRNEMISVIGIPFFFIAVLGLMGFTEKAIDKQFK